MDPQRKLEVIQTRVATAQDDLASAQVLFDAGRWRATINRAYYAVFHMALAALIWHDQERERHSGVNSAFSQFLVKPGLIEKKYGETLGQLRRARERQDYDIDATPAEEADAATAIDLARRFVKRLEEYLREVGATHSSHSKSNSEL